MARRRLYQNGTVPAHLGAEILRDGYALRDGLIRRLAEEPPQRRRRRRLRSTAPPEKRTQQARCEDAAYSEEE